MVEKIQESDLSFEDRINEVLDKRLRDQTTLPAEFRSWLPKFIEIQDIRLPMSQVSGLYLTGETVESLGSDVHGRIGMVRGGTTPYDFVQVTFDGVYDKWVSDPVIYWTALGTYTGITWTSYTASTNGPYWPWEAYDTAGLKPQFRFIAWLDNTVAQTTSATLAMSGISSGETAVSGTSTASWQITNTGTTGTFRDTDWQDAPTVAVKEFFVVDLMTKTTATGSGIVGPLQVFIRWVNK